MDLSRLEYLVGKEKIAILKTKTVLIAGVGGVGSFVAEALARSGVGTLILYDYDVIDSSNVNRQLMVNKANIGEIKVEALAKHLKEISNCKIVYKNVFIDQNTKIPKCDYVVDCIDTLTSKFALVKMCHELDLPIISSLGSAKRIKPENIKHTTLDKTRNDALAKAFRALVKKENYKRKIDVVYCDSTAIKTNVVCEGNTNKEKYPLGSSIFVVGSVGLYIASIVFEKLIEEKK
ncbi:MAG: ThiF family adenylyltransferase [Erysipelotrichaceae bacterium]|nr:ThiF family adenylyltransferase [Erysipelotrichaceae bacterium]